MATGWKRQYTFYYSFPSGGLTTSDTWWLNVAQRHAVLDDYATRGVYHKGLTDNPAQVESDSDYDMYYNWPGGVPGEVRRYWVRYTDVDFQDYAEADSVNVHGGSGVYRLENVEVPISMALKNFWSDDYGVPYLISQDERGINMPYDQAKSYNPDYVGGNGSANGHGFSINRDWVRDYHKINPSQGLLLSGSGIYLQTGGNVRLLHERYRSWYNYRIGPIKNAALVRQNILNIIERG